MATTDGVANIPLVVIVGPTASGKSGLAVRLAKQVGGEIISADSRSVYRGLSIGTAKASPEDLRKVPHWGIDLVEPDERFSAADFQKYAFGKIAEIRSRGKIPILAGGTGLYIDSVIYNFSFSGKDVDFETREFLTNQSIDWLHTYCYKHHIKLPENHLNKRYVVNNIIHANSSNSIRESKPDNTIVVGIITENSNLEYKINTRIDQMFANGVVEEAEMMAKAYGWGCEAMTGNVYRIIRRYLADELDLDEAKRLCVVKDKQLAKRQMTWFKRNRDIKWFDLEGAYTFLVHELGVTPKK
ncbi:MAG: tRNA (adenosine(37)-N6)-dimethylallyltransferase MiaA [Candidatus Saccharimonas sp.]